LNDSALGDFAERELSERGRKYESAGAGLQQLPLCLRRKQMTNLWVSRATSTRLMINTTPITLRRSLIKRH